MPGPKASGRIPVNVLIDPRWKKKITKAAALEGVSFSAWMRQAAVERLLNMDTKKEK
jgi:predicted HicB family RNase H-like nuclease